MALNRDAILKAGLRREAVSVPDLGGEVYVRVLTLREVGEIQHAQKDAADPLSVYPRLVMLAAVNEDGSPLFDPNDKEAVAGLPWPVVNTIAEAALRISRMAPEDKGGPKGD